MPIGKDSIRKRVAKTAPECEVITVNPETGDIVSKPWSEPSTPDVTPEVSICPPASEEEDVKFWEALELVVSKEKVGVSALQRGCGLGYRPAAALIDRFEELGFIGSDLGNKQGRAVLITPAELERYKKNGLPSQKPAPQKTAPKKKPATKKPVTSAETSAETVAPPPAPATSVMANVSPETVEKVIGHPETTPSEHVQIGHKMPNYLL